MAGLRTRELTPDDWRIWRTLRQAALAQSPAAFGSTLAEWTGAGDTERRWRARLRDVPLNLVAEFDGALVGMVSVTDPDAGGDVELISLWVDPCARGRGIGDELVKQAVFRASARFPGCRLTLSVKPGNQHAIALYRRHGFADADVSPDDPTERRMVRLRPDPTGSGAS